MIKRTNSGVYMISTSRHPACLMASAVRQISAFVMLTALMCENVVGPICRASRQSGDETANPPASSWPGILMREPRSLGVGFLFMLIISRIRRSAFQKGLKFFLHAILPRMVREQDHATHETLELAERESSVDWTLRSHCRRGDRVRHRRTRGADARSLLGGNRDSGRDAIQSRRYPDALHRTRSRYGPGRVGRSDRVKLFRSKSDRISNCDRSRRLALLWLSFGEDRLSICQCHPDDHRCAHRCCRMARAIRDCSEERR